MLHDYGVIIRVMILYNGPAGIFSPLTACAWSRKEQDLWGTTVLCIASWVTHRHVYSCTHTHIHDHERTCACGKVDHRCSQRLVTHMHCNHAICVLIYPWMMHILFHLRPNYQQKLVLKILILVIHIFVHSLIQVNSFHLILWNCENAENEVAVILRIGYLKKSCVNILFGRIIWNSKWKYSATWCFYLVWSIFLTHNNPSDYFNYNWLCSEVAFINVTVKFFVG